MIGIYVRGKLVATAPNRGAIGILVKRGGKLSGMRITYCDGDLPKRMPRPKRAHPTVRAVPK